MKKRIFLLAALAAGLVLCLAACGETNGDPITVTLWHVYGGEVNSPMNALVDEFNRTVGQEQGGQRQQQRRYPRERAGRRLQGPRGARAAGPVRVLPKDRAGAAG